MVLAAVCLNSAQGLEIIAIEKGGTIRWQALEGHAYTVESRDGLTAPWEVVAPEDQWPIEAAEWLVNGGAGWPAVGQRFYRVMAEPVESDYLVVDLSDGPSASSYPISYLSAVPAGGWTDEYKTTKMVFRIIPAGTFIMGAPLGELGRRDGETQHQVTLTQDFYIGVFEVTQKQWERVMGTWPSYFSNTSYRDARPVEQVTYDMIRGSSAGAGWPANNDVDADSFMGRLRARTGRAFDLPAESQWEYAGRAGTTTALNSGKNLTDERECPNMAEVGRYWFNGGEGAWRESTTSAGTAKVGSYMPNGWGPYDIHGNVFEWCLDWGAAYHGTVTDPRGPKAGSSRIIRGGCWSFDAFSCRSAARYGITPSAVRDYIGFRAAVPPDQ